MSSTRLTARDRLVYGAGFTVAALLVYAMHFTSHDGDSALYAAIGGHTSAEPLRQWVAPKWWALWPGSTIDELFIEHPAGLFWLPAALGRLGLPAAPSAYVVGVGASLLTLVGLSALIARIDGPVAARATLTLLPLMPVAFVFRVRANHEYPMLLCLVVALVALEGRAASRGPGSSASSVRPSRPRSSSRASLQRCSRGRRRRPVADHQSDVRATGSLAGVGRLRHRALGTRARGAGL